MSIPSFSEFPEIPQRSTPEADFDAKMYALFQHFATTHRAELLAFIDFLEQNSTVIGAALNGTSIGLTTPAAAKFTDLEVLGAPGVLARFRDGVASNFLVQTAGNKTTIGNAEGSSRLALMAGNQEAIEFDSAGRASGAAVQASAYDASEGKLQSVGGFGLGSRRLQDTTYVVSDIDDITLAVGFYGVTDGTTGVKPNNFGVLQVVPLVANSVGTNQITQMFWPSFANPEMYLRHYREGAGWSDWRELYHDGGLTGPITVGGGSSKFGYRAANGSAAIEIGGERIADGPAYLDLVGDTVYSDYGARLIRNSGENGSTVLSCRGSGGVTISCSDGANLVLRSHPAHSAVLDAAGNFRSGNDNASSCGSSSFRWSQIYAANGTINTSDVRTKQDIQDLDAAERRVAVAAKGLLKKYRMREAVAEKGDDARWHFGIIAQELAAAFEDEGLDPWRYGVLCWDQWWSAEVEIPAETAPITDENGVLTGEFETLLEARTELQTFTSAEDAPAGATYHDRQGVRYDELFAFILAAI